jgi:hypothetical protein
MRGGPGDARSLAAVGADRHTEQMTKYNRTHQDLQALVLSLGHEGNWTPGANSVWRFVRRDRAGMNWSETTGTLWFDGPGIAKAALQASIESALVGDGHPEGI